MRSTLALLSLIVVSAPVAAQKGKPKETARPRMAASRDTNNPMDYYMHGMGLLQNDPEEAFRAFHWASRLDPAWAEPLYAKRIAYHLSNPQRLGDYLSGRGYAKTKEVVAIDSLQNQAQLRNPVLFRGLDFRMWQAYFYTETGVTVVPSDFAGADPGQNAWLSYIQANFPRAIELYGKALKKDKEAYGYHADRAFAFYQLARTDSAVAELQQLIAADRSKEKKDVVVFYRSKAFAEYTIGWIYEVGKQPAKAKEAYGRALAEDLSFYMAHLRLADLAMAAGDSATALQEYDLAVQLKSDDPTLRSRFGQGLIEANRPLEAVTQLEKAIELNPYYAEPHFYLAFALDVLKQKERAVAMYERFLQMAPKGAQALIGQAKERLAALKAGT